MAKKLIPSEGSFLLFRKDDGRIDINVIFDQDTVWLTQEQMATLFGKSKSTISEHISNIFQEKELIQEACTHKFGISEFMQKAPTYYNLDVIISVGYRVKSIVGTQFRQWATKRINEYMRKGYTLDDERLKELGGGGYWKELRILQQALDKFPFQPVVELCLGHPLIPSNGITADTQLQSNLSLAEGFS